MNQSQFYVDEISGRAPFALKSDVPPSNIVFITTDMVPPDFWQHGPFEHVRRTPNLDALARTGVVFDNCYATAPVCSPSRAAFLTGRHSYITTNEERRHDGQDVHLRSNDTIFPEYLKRLGFYTRHVGKSHVGHGKFLDAFGENDNPWDRWSPPWYDDDSYRVFLSRHGLEPFAFERSIRGRTATGDADGNFYGGWLAPQNGRAFPTTATYPWYLAERAIDALQNHDGNRFYLQLDFFAPHQPFAIPGDMLERERELRAALTTPESYRELEKAGFKAPAGEPRVYRVYRRNWGLSDADTMIEYIIANLLQYEVIDAAVGRFLDHLRDIGVYDNTTIVYAADHGEMNGEMALIDKGAFLNPRVLRVPLVVKPADAVARDFAPGVCSRPVSLIDVAPTVLRVAGVSAHDRFDGVALQSAVSGEPRPDTKPVLAEVWSHVIPNPAVGIVFDAADGESYLFSFNVCDDVSELYRLDPSGHGLGELKNLFHDGAHQDIMTEAVNTLERVLASDERWKGFHAYIQTVFAQVLGARVGDTQRFEASRVK